MKHFAAIKHFGAILALSLVLVVSSLGQSFGKPKTHSGSFGKPPVSRKVAKPKKQIWVRKGYVNKHGTYVKPAIVRRKQH